MIQNSVLDHRSQMSEVIHEALRNGAPEVGWKGDPELVATHSRLHGWELWRPAPEGGHELIARQRAGAPFNLTKLCKQLADRDTLNRGVDHMDTIDELLARADMIHAEKERKIVEALYEPTARATAAVARESGNPIKTFW